MGVINGFFEMSGHSARAEDISSNVFAYTWPFVRMPKVIFISIVYLYLFPDGGTYVGREGGEHDSFVMVAIHHSV